MHPMRRKKQALTEQETVAILERGAFGVVGTCGDDDSGYCVPVNYAYADGKIYFHSATSGHKIDAIRHNPKVNFLVVDQSKPVPEDITDYFRSAMCFGVARFADADESATGLRLLGKKYCLGFEEKYEAEILSALDHSRVSVVVIDVDEMSGKEAIELVQAREQ